MCWTIPGCWWSPEQTQRQGSELPGLFKHRRASAKDPVTSRHPLCTQGLWKPHFLVPTGQRLHQRFFLKLCSSSCKTNQSCTAAELGFPTAGTLMESPFPGSWIATAAVGPAWGSVRAAVTSGNSKSHFRPDCCITWE